ncbi:amino acid adenylation domain-containing protein [Chitinophaga filiformis]|uniref:Amino acid adenylation domain-containing protein n=1 Tax=Chitinophaga filiformis TaxID=104663 RepID=A0ABY4I250_CHIFI|nr:non-ribosomal peptide synthetase [Chitinophaga filiformis]UPK68821.1 amino acid adenylation domain-containing protein [Chitinophaga filiformis]
MHDTALSKKYITDYWVAKVLPGENNIVPAEHARKHARYDHIISGKDIQYIVSRTKGNPLSEFVIYHSLYHSLLRKYFPAYQNIIVTPDIEHGSFCALKERYLYFKTVTANDNTLRDITGLVKTELQEVLKFKDYDPAVLEQRLAGLGRSLAGNLQYGFSFSPIHPYADLLQVDRIGMHIAVNDQHDLHITLTSDVRDVAPFIADQFLQHFGALLTNLEQHINTRYDQLSLLSDAERNTILVEFNKTQYPFPEEKTIVDIFEEQVLKTPNATALVYKDKVYTYASLNNAANKLAHYFKTHFSIQPEEIIGLMIPKSDITVIGILAILKAGATYLPIATDYPAHRIRYIIGDSKVKLLLTLSGIEMDAADAGITRINYDLIDLRQEPEQNLDISIRPVHLAYIIYTSGSTGHPKGVMIAHRSNVNMSLDQIRIFSVTQHDKVLLFAPLSFDASISEVFMALYCGAAIIVPDEKMIKDKDVLIRYMKAKEVSVVTFPPSFLDLLSEDDIEGLRCIITAGEAARPAKAVATARKVAYFNAYGPTECAVCVSTYRVGDKDQDSVNIPIGKPIANLSVYILDDSLQPVPIGIIGKIYVAGVGLAREYLGKPEISREKFIANPFAAGERMYDTGDMGRWLKDGNIEFYGRADDQVKIRGHRIEPGEVEDALFRVSKAITQAAVMARTVKGEISLVAYYVSSELIDKAWLRQELMKLLPDYMIPSFFVKIKALPLTPNGKVDKKALPDVSGQDVIRKAYSAPETETEQHLAAIWQEILGLGQVGVTDNFFELGGNSLMITRVGSAIRNDFSIDIPVSTLFANPTIRLLGHYIKQHAVKAVLPHILPQERPEKIPLSFSQERLWLIHQLEGSLSYHLPVVLQLQGKLEKALLEKAFLDLIERHEILRTVIRSEKGEAFQEIITAGNWQLQYIPAFKGAYDTLVEEALQKPFDLAKDYLIRVCLLAISEQEHILIIVMHHMIADGWSMPIFVRELIEYYQAEKEQRIPALQPLAVQYRDYAVWQRKYYSGSLLDGKLAYWKDRLNGMKPLSLPADAERYGARGEGGNTLYFSIEKELTQQLKDLSARENVTLFMTLLTAFKILLYRYSGHEDIAVGIPVANRGQLEIGPLIGFFVNTIVLRSSLDGQISFREMLAKVKETTLEAYNFQDVPFEKVVGNLERDRNFNQADLFQVLFALQNNERVDKWTTGDINFSLLPFVQKTCRFDLAFNITEEAQGLQVAIQYSTELFLSETIDRLFAHYRTLLHDVVRRPEGKSAELTILTKEEQQQLRFTFNNFQNNYPREQTIVTLFEEQALRVPDATAIVFGDRSLTYRKVKEASDRLAHRLVDQGVKKGDMVIICLDDAMEMMLAGILGIMKAGAAYVPVDTDYPAERIDYIIADTQASVAVSNKACTALNHHASLQVLRIDDEVTWDIPAGSPALSLAPDDTLYVIYTSGSTGQPKGVMVTHRNVVDYTFGIFSKTTIKSNGTFGLMSTISTDLGNTVIFSAMLSGGSLHLFPKEMLTNPGRLHQYFKDHIVDCIKIVPSYWKTLETDGALLLPARMIIFGGEELSGAIVRAIHKAAPGLTIINHYGPTETTIGKLLHVVEPGRNYGSVPVGQVFSNSQAYIVDSNFSLCPVGVWGELLIGGDGVAKGYLNREELTRERFIDNIFSGSGRLYRTGDSVRRLADGNIVFKGRIDSQVKIRGYRVEPGEIETVIQKHNGIRQCAVLAKQDVLGNNQLVAYIVTTPHYTRDALHSFLKACLPAYMIPSLYIELEKIPLTSNGKIDRRALPEPQEIHSAASAAVPPRNELERQLVAIWQDLLGRQQIGVTDNFFELGGNSLIAIRLINRIDRQLNRTIGLKDIFNNFDIQGLAAVIEKQKEDGHLVIPKALERNDYELSPNQRRLWMAAQVPGNEASYNISGGLMIEGEVSIPILEQAFRHLVQRHESLRTIFIIDGAGLPRQKILATGLTNFEFASSNEMFSDAAVQQLINRENSIPFELYDQQLFRLKVLALQENKYLLMLIMHHIISDGWSMELLIREWIAVYYALSAGKEPILPFIHLQYRDFSEWENSFLRSEAFENTIAYWKRRLDGEMPVLHLPLSNGRSATTSSAGKGFVFSVDLSLYEAVKELAVEKRTSLFSVLLTAFNVLLYHVSHQRQIMLGTSVAGRRHSDLEPVVGFFVNTIVLKTSIDPSEKFATLLERSSKELLEDFAHQDMPFEELVNHLSYERQPGLNPFFQARFVLNNDGDDAFRKLEQEQLKVARVVPGEINSKFDLSLVMRSGQKQLSGTVEYRSALFKEEVIQLIVAAYIQCLEAVTKDPDSTVSDLDTYTPAYKKQMVDHKKGLQQDLLKKMQHFNKAKIK